MLIYYGTYMLISKSISYVEDVLVLIFIYELDIASPTGTNMKLDY